MPTVLGWAVVGLVVGLVAWSVGPGRHTLGALPAIIFGVAGAVACGLAASVVWDDPTASRAGAGLALAAVGATLALWGYLAAVDTDGTELPTGA